MILRILCSCERRFELDDNGAGNFKNITCNNCGQEFPFEAIVKLNEYTAARKQLKSLLGNHFKIEEID